MIYMYVCMYIHIHTYMIYMTAAGVDKESICLLALVLTPQLP